MIPKPQRDDKGKVISDFYPLQKAELIALCKAKLNNNVASVYLALLLENSQGDRPISVSIKEFAYRWKIPESSVYEAITKINRVGGNLAVEIKSPVRVEHQIRALLQSQLGGLTEVATPAGWSDLLTDTEIIEVKAVKDCQPAMGQVLAYSGFYPEHQKRIHLFARPGDTSSEYALLQARSICDGLGIAVTFEEVN